MSDVLRRLALRVLPGAGASVRPRLGSRFETRPAALEMPDAGGAEARSGAVAPAAAPPSRAAGDPARPAVGPAPFPIAPAAPREANPVAAAPIGRSPLAAPTESLATPVSSAAPIAFAPPTAAAADAPDTAGPPAFPAPARAEAISRPEAGAPQLLLPEMRQASAAESPAAGAAAARGEELAPDIRISIGRIDVRAGSERMTPPRPHSRSRPTLMSLEDYLGRGRSRS